LTATRGDAVLFPPRKPGRVEIEEFDEGAICGSFRNQRTRLAETLLLKCSIRKWRRAAYDADFLLEQGRRALQAAQWA
jgi:hypothetical protein